MTTTLVVQKDGRAVIPVKVLKKLGAEPGTRLNLEIKVEQTSDRGTFPQEIPPDKTVQDFLHEYEEKYQMSSEEFYHKYMNGEIEDEFDFHDWAGYYKTKLLLEERGEDPSKVTFELYVPSGIEINAG